MDEMDYKDYGTMFRDDYNPETHDCCSFCGTPIPKEDLIYKYAGGAVCEMCEQDFVDAMIEGGLDYETALAVGSTERPNSFLLWLSNVWDCEEYKVKEMNEEERVQAFYDWLTQTVDKQNLAAVLCGIYEGN